MNDDFFYALLTGWFILVIFWCTILIFILIRKPPKSKLTNGTIMKSIFLFLIFLLLIYLIRYSDSFYK